MAQLLRLTHVLFPAPTWPLEQPITLSSVTLSAPLASEGPAYIWYINIHAGKTAIDRK